MNTVIYCLIRRTALRISVAVRLSADDVG